MDKSRTWSGTLRRAWVLALLIWLAVGTVRIHPFYLAYFNELVGGPGNGYKYLTDANLDWGQDLKRLGRYIRVNGIVKVKLAYFGGDDPRMYGIAYEQLHPGEPATGYVAVSVTALTGMAPYRPGCERAFAWLQQFEPVAKIGYSIFVYHILSTERLPPPVPLPECSAPRDLFREDL